MASPVVAGIAALYLQKKPTAGYQEIKDAIRLTAYEDSFTGFNLPDPKWGYGKVDAFAAMTINITYGCTDPFSINFDPAATVDDGSCQPIVFGCTDINAQNYNADANMNDGSCTYNVGLSNIAGTTLCILAYPNPSSGGMNFYCQSGDGEKGTIVITDLSGIEVDRLTFHGSKEILTYNNHLAPGLYFYRLETNTSSSAVKKLVIF